MEDKTAFSLLDQAAASSSVMPWERHVLWGEVSKAKDVQSIHQKLRTQIPAPEVGGDFLQVFYRKTTKGMLGLWEA